MTLLGEIKGETVHFFLIPAHTVHVGNPKQRQTLRQGMRTFV